MYKSFDSIPVCLWFHLPKRCSHQQVPCSMAHQNNKGHNRKVVWITKTKNWLMKVTTCTTEKWCESQNQRIDLPWQVLVQFQSPKCLKEGRGCFLLLQEILYYLPQTDCQNYIEMSDHLHWEEGIVQGVTSSVHYQYMTPRCIVPVGLPQLVHLHLESLLPSMPNIWSQKHDE